MEEKPTKKMSNVFKWNILISVILISIIGSGIFTIVCNNNQKTVLASTHINDENILEENVPKDEGSIEELASAENKTEEELKELNEKELKEAEKEAEKETEKNNKENQKENNNQNKTTSKTKPKNKYYIKVNYGAQVVNIYTYDSDGKYTVPVKAMVCSTGTATPRSGVYKTPVKMTWCHMYGGVWAHYCTQIVGNILFHSVPFTQKNNHSLEYWEYDKLGKKASMGCIRLTTRDAKWLFDNVPVGTSVEFYSSSNPGPLGKPSAPKISNAPGDLKNWDPTDPDPKNPWIDYNSGKEENKQNESKPSSGNQNNQSQGGTSQNQENQNNQSQGGTSQNQENQNNQSQGGTSQNQENQNNQTQGGTSQNQENQNNQTQGGTNQNQENQNNQTQGGTNQNQENQNNQSQDGTSQNQEN